MERVELTSLGQISEADISFGDLTVFVGEQASGKSILLQLVKLILDAGDITRTLKKHGIEEPEMGLHPQSISVLLVILFDLLRRGYKVIVSTHSSQVPELVWAIQFSTKAADIVTRAVSESDL